MSLTMSALAQTNAAKETRSMDRYILGYVTDGALPSVTAEDAGRLTHINLAFGKVRDGLLDMSQMPHVN